MNIGLYNGVTAGSANSKRLEAITANLANVETPAYKRISSSTRAFQIPGGGSGDIELKTTSETDFSQGALTPSSNPYHVALMGSGFFAVEGPDGELLTRNGQFHVDDKGVLQSAEGYPVAWESSTGPINPTGELIAIDGSGVLRQGQEELGRLKFVDFERPQALGSIGSGYYTANAKAQEKPSEATVYQHSLEASNVKGIDELVGMITIQRSFENAKNVMSLIDQSYGRLTQIR